MSVKYKYNLNHLLSLLPPGIYPEDIIAQLEVMYKVYSHEFHRDRYILVEDLDEIPTERLLIYSEVLQVSIDRIKNMQPV